MYICKECNTKYLKWCARCKCGSWSMEEHIEEILPKKKKTQPYVEMETFEEEDSSVLNTSIVEFNRVSLLVKKSLIVIGGEPGVGKSTLMCQIASEVLEKCIYLTGEESVSNVKKRIDRVGTKKIDVMSFFYIETMEEIIKKHRPSLVILDSIHTTRSANSESSISQIRDIVFFLSDLSKKYNFCCLMVSHITKEGTIAGPKMLEHMVDVVLYLEGNRYESMRLLRSVKNRFGNTHEVGVFEMTEKGMMEITNPSALFISQKKAGVPGSVIYAGLSGTRSMFVEIQSLVTSALFPQIESIGIEPKRLKMIMAILQHWCKINLSKHDIYINVVGGIKVTDASSDLAIAAAILSSLKKRSISAEVCFFGELGLTGEIRRTYGDNIRIKEAKRLGFKKIYANSDDQDVAKLENIQDFLRILEKN